MADLKPPPSHPQQPDQLKTPAKMRLPDGLWSAMSNKDREQFAESAQSLERIGADIDAIGAMRGDHINFEAEVDADIAVLPNGPEADSVREYAVKQANSTHARMDSIREDLKAIHSVRVTEFDKFMWRVVWEQTQKQRADDQRSQSRYNQITLTCSIISLVIAVAAVVVTWAHK
jgi:hypothetical protein